MKIFEKSKNGICLTDFEWSTWVEIRNSSLSWIDSTVMKLSPVILIRYVFNFKLTGSSMRPFAVRSTDGPIPRFHFQAMIHNWFWPETYEIMELTLVILPYVIVGKHDERKVAWNWPPPGAKLLRIFAPTKQFTTASIDLTAVIVEPCSRAPLIEQKSRFFAILKFILKIKYFWNNKIRHGRKKMALVFSLDIFSICRYFVYQRIEIGIFGWKILHSGHVKILDNILILKLCNKSI